METFDYDSLFANQRVIVFSLTNFRALCSINQLISYSEVYDRFKEHGIDNIYVVDSTDWLIGPYIEKREPRMIGLPDRDLAFVNAVAEYGSYQKDPTDLARFWQYVLVINNGQPEKLCHNPFATDAPTAILKDLTYRYRKLSADVILKYLVDNPM